MAEENTCPECGALLPASAPHAPCAACLMKLGLQSWTARQEEPQPPEEGHPPERTRTAAKLHAFTAPTPAELAPHFPQLEIIELRGQGGMGAVYKARQKSLDRLVALKIIHPEAAEDPGFASRFAREAKALARLNHPHIVGIHDFGQAGDMYYLLMEYVDGVDLRALIADGAMRPAEALALVPQICDALQFAHEEGIVHRDIKPENILVDKRGRVKIADFGLAKMLRLSAGDFTLTHTRHVVGTFHYMAPEQFERPNEIDHRVDIYALGVVFYEMLTGLLPVGRFDLPSQRCAVDARLDEVVLKALEREPDRRYQHASDVKTDVQSFSAVPSQAAAAAPVQAIPGKQPPIQGVDEAELESVRDDLAMPAVGLMVYGGLLVTAAVGGFVAFFVAEVFENAFLGNNELASLVALCLVGGVLGGLILAAGMRMRRLENYDFVLAGVIITLCTFFTPFTVIFAVLLGVTSLRLLKDPRVKRAFALRRSLAQQDPDAVAQRQIARTVATPAWGLIVLGSVNLIYPLVLVMLVSELDRDDPPVLMLLLSLPAGAVILWGGLAMRRFAMYGATMTAAIVAMLPISPLWFLSLPFGWMAVRALRKPRVLAQFAQAAETDEPPGDASQKPDDAVPPSLASDAQGSAPDNIQLMLRPLATVLSVAGTLSLVFGILGLIAGFLAVRHSATAFVMVFAVVHAILAVLTAPVILLGSTKIWRCESRGLALTAAVVGMLPLNVTWLFSFPAGVWALIVLNRRDVEQAFQERSHKIDPFEMQHALGKAAWLLKATALAHVLTALAWWATYVFNSPQPTEWFIVTTFVSAMSAVLILTAAVLVAGANHMQRGESLAWSRAASLAALLPVSPGVLIGLPAGLFALSLLTRPGASQWFATPQAKPIPGEAVAMHGMEHE